MNEIQVTRLSDGPFKTAVLRTVELIPSGTVAASADIAEYLGYPREAGKLVEWVVESRAAESVPWHRVVGDDGTLTRRDQADLLNSEGVEIEGARVDFSRFRWRPPPPAQEFRGPILSRR